MDDAELIAAFHTLWDGFPGMARLIDSHHVVLASNQAAAKKGFTEGVTCVTVGDPSIHRMCKLNTMFKERTAQTDNVIEDRIRGWIPVKGREDVCIHFALPLPED